MTIALVHTDGRVVAQDQAADGPVDAVVKAIDHATGIRVQVSTFEVHSVTVGEDAQGEAVLTGEHNGRSYRGAGISTGAARRCGRRSDPAFSSRWRSGSKGRRRLRIQQCPE